MEVKPGYKQTEVGVIPDEWEVSTAAAVCDLVVDCKNRTPPVVEGGDYAVVRTPNVRKGRFIRDDLRFTDQHSFREWTARAIPQVGDILITREAPLGEVCLVPPDVRVCLGQRMMLYRTDREKADSHFLLYALMSSGVQSYLLRKIGGSTVGHAKVDDIRNLLVPLPSTRAEQEAIAEALSDADALIESLEQLLAKKRQLKQGVMHGLLTGKKRLPGFSGKWEVTSLGNVAPLQRGFDLPTSKIRQGPYPVAYSNGVLNYHSVFQVKGPGVVTGRSGTIGTVTFVEQNFWPHNTSLWVTNFKGNDPKFIFYLYTRIGLEQFATGSGVPTLNRNDVHAFKIGIPSTIAEQSAIAAILSDMDAEIAALEAKLTKARRLKQGMMQELLTGRIRLVPPSESVDSCPC